MKGKMNAIIKVERKPGAILKNVGIPVIDPDEVLIEVQAASICGTDLHIYNWDNWAAKRVNPPLVIGHEVAGKIVEVGGRIEKWSIGDYVSVECHNICGSCYQCRTGQAHLCRDFSILGVDFDGIFANYVKAPATSLWKNEPTLSPETASLQDPVGNAVLTVFSQEISTKKVAVIGCGSIGLLSIGIAKAVGAEKVYAIDVIDYRLDIAQKMGSYMQINAKDTNVVDVLMKDTLNEGVDVILEMSGNAAALTSGLKYIKNGGNVALLGLYPGKTSLDLSNDIVFKGLTMRGITGRKIWDTWYKTAALLNSKQLDVSPVITHKLPMERFEEGFAAMNSGECGKVILYP